MTNGSGEHGPAAVPLFTFRVDEIARRLALGDKPSWRFPCGLCNELTVSEPGELCSRCAPKPDPSRKRRTRSTTTTPASKTGKRAPAWERVAEQPDDQGTPRLVKWGDS